jgi:hypothetical protein
LDVGFHWGVTALFEEQLMRQLPRRVLSDRQ